MDTEGKMDIGWEHVSLHAYDPFFHKAKTPTWDQMCYAKDLFWDEDEVVMQIHVAKKDWISNHDHVLHLWSPKGEAIPLPPKICV